MKRPVTGNVNKVRIIAGFWRSRTVHIENLTGLRPSTDRVRETLFNWIAPLLPGSKCLDLFAGSGVLGFEAASRGAKFVQCVEIQHQAFLNLQNNLDLLKPLPTGCQIDLLKSDALSWLKHNDVSSFEIIFVDPPFDDVNLLKNTLKTLGNTQFLTKSTIIYVESPSKLENEVILEDLPNWQIDRQMIAGAVKASLLKQIV